MLGSTSPTAFVTSASPPAGEVAVAVGVAVALAVLALAVLAPALLEPPDAAETLAVGLAATSSAPVGLSSKPRLSKPRSSAPGLSSKARAPPPLSSKPRSSIPRSSAPRSAALGLSSWATATGAKTRVDRATTIATRTNLRILAPSLRSSRKALLQAIAWSIPSRSLSPPDDLAIRQDGVLGGVVGQDRVAPGTAVDEVVLGLPALAGIYQVSATSAIESI